MSLDNALLKNYTPPEMVDLIKGMNEPAYRAEQVLDWIYRKKVLEIDKMTNLPIAFREALKERFRVKLLYVKDKWVSAADGTMKFLLETWEGELLECAVMKQDYGNTVCVSSQIGCGMGCVFCASSRGGLVRNLSSGEMLEQVILADINLQEKGEEKNKVKNVVVMGMGEPLHNLRNLLRFLLTLNHPRGLGLSYRNITVSTAGIAPKILELAEHKLPITLAVSLHAPDDETRTGLMPINKKYPVKEVLDSCKQYVDIVGRRITFEYVLIAGVNDSREKAHQLSKLLKGWLVHVNLIPANPVEETGIKRPAKKNVRAFLQVLQAHDISVSMRKERGADIEGACGQLRRRYAKLSEDGV